MTSIVNEITTRLTAADPYAPESVLLSAIVVVVLLSLLIFKELLRASGHPRFDAWGRVLNRAIVPLTLAFIFIVLVRFLALLPT
jgi:hypothetical protein